MRTPPRTITHAHFPQHHSHSNLQLKTFNRRPSTRINMPELTKAEWMQRLENAGARVPKTWTILQMKSLWQELEVKEDREQEDQKDRMMKELKTAAKKKANILEYVKGLGARVDGKMTIARLFAVGECTITEQFPANGNDLTGFGEHSDLTYEEVFQQKPKYSQWVIKTNQEEPESGWRLQRLARWLEQRKHEEMSQDLKGPKSSEGYQRKKAASSTTSVESGSFEMISPMDQEIIMLKAQIKKLEEEMEETQTPLSGHVRADDIEGHLSEALAAQIFKEWQPQNNKYTGQWTTLHKHERPLLMELACYSDSLLSGEVLKRYGPGSAIRCSEWNGGDLETKQGVEHAKQLIKYHRPVNLWVSCTCGPFCPLQRLNRRNETQVLNLENKQKQARKQYQGAMEVARYAHSLGTQVHWEFSERSEGWKLPEVVCFLAELRLEKVTCHGCAVGLRAKDQQKALCKGWTVATRNEELLQHLNLRCQ